MTQKIYNIKNIAILFAVLTMFMIVSPIYGLPSVDVDEMYPATPTTTDDLTVNVTCSDPVGGGASLTVYWDIYKDDIIQASLGGSMVVTNETETLVYTIGSGNTSKTEEWLAEVWCSNSTDNSTKINTTTRTIINTAPTTTVPILSPTTAYETETPYVTCNNVSVTDVDEDTITWNYQWFVDNVADVTTQTIT